jgi:hypothetical protein
MMTGQLPWLVLWGALAVTPPPGTIAVLVVDPLGHTTDMDLGEQVAGRLRGSGRGAVAIPGTFARPPSRATADRAAQRSGANLIMVVEVKQADRTRDRTARAVGNPDRSPARQPAVRVWRFEVGPVVMPIEPHNEVGPPGPTGPTSEAEMLDQVPSVSHAIVNPEVVVRESIETQTRITLRPVGQQSPTVDRQLGIGAQNGWRADLAPRGVERDQHLWRVLTDRIADEAAKVIVKPRQVARSGG